MICPKTNEQVYNVYLNMILSACRRKQYQRVQTLLPGALAGARYNRVIDSRLITIIHDMAGFYAANNNESKAKALYEYLLQFKQTPLLSGSGFDDYLFIKVAVDKLSSKKSIDGKSAQSYKNLFKMFTIPGWLSSAFSERKKAAA